ncbi:hypothetical protein GCM10027280_52280 [Micromonospora polyrhachis]|uniref:DUF1349 domain-containing protein n=1 Tax=Micromonospora polyrhachis TaxID=1282883 RepID=A0A7W7SP75_9ACTN|nr:DUF1349 domain-containing protein [Micromonospora polyrhachis]MBB4957195.1 hypothetical protein [Micromonospora polyrhachis]
MPETNEVTGVPLGVAVRREWSVFRSRGRVLALTAAALVTVLLGLLAAVGGRSSCSEGDVAIACPTDPVGPNGQAVTDHSYFAHQPLDGDGSITVRMTDLTGIITYPPPNHDEIVSGLVPWAKAGIMIKDGTTPGSSYAALMLTGKHGVRMQYDYVHDIAGRSGGVSAEAPRWLRLTRTGDTITGHESNDGAQWTKVGVARLPGLPRTVQVGLFATSPGDLTLRRTGLGASTSEVRFTQATAVFDNVSLAGGASAGEWQHAGTDVQTDWERYHRAPGLVESDGTLTVTGSGDIGPIGAVGGRTPEDTLVGLAIGLMIVIVLAVRFATRGLRPGRTGVASLSGRDLVAKAGVVGPAAFLAGLVAAGITVPLSAQVMRATGTPTVAVPTLTELRLVVGVAALYAVTAVLALSLGALVRRSWAAILVATSMVVLPYVLGALPLLPDDVSRWLLRLTPAAGFAVQQTIREYPQVVAHYVPSTGYFPLAWWAGLAVLCGYALVAFGMAIARTRRAGSDDSRGVEVGPPRSGQETSFRALMSDDTVDVCDS